MPSDALLNANWIVTLNGETSRDITAAYWNVDGDTGWLEFKTPDHKCVFATHQSNVHTVERRV